MQPPVGRSCWERGHRLHCCIPWAKAGQGRDVAQGNAALLLRTSAFLSCCSALVFPPSLLQAGCVSPLYFCPLHRGPNY